MQNAKFKMQTMPANVPRLHFAFCILNYLSRDSRRPHQHRHDALARSGCPALFRADLHVEIEQIHEPPDRRGVELAKGLLAAVTHLAEDRATNIDRAFALAPLHDGAA